MTFLENLLMFIGRLCISAMFLWWAAETVMNWHATLSQLRFKRVPQPNIVLPISLMVKILGSLFILFGFYPRVGALLLVFVLVPTAIRFHNFWDLQGSEKVTEKANFMKDVAITGGLLFILALGGGGFSFN